jgi:hypothetical protein
MTDLSAVMQPTQYRNAGSWIRAREIKPADLPRLAPLLARNLPAHTQDFWSDVLARLAERSTLPQFPRYGYLLDSDHGPVGAILLIFSAIPGRQTKVRCNVSSWFVEPKYRAFASLLVAKALRHKHVTYLNVTPSRHTLSTINVQGYSQYSRGVFVSIPSLQRCVLNAKIERVLAAKRTDGFAESFEHMLLVEHSGFGCVSLRCTSTEGTFPFIFRPRKHKFLPFAQLVFCKSVESYVQHAGAIGWYLLSLGLPLVVIDSNGPIRGLVGKYFHGRMPKYFKGPDEPRLGDLAYTEVAMFGI